MRHAGASGLLDTASRHRASNAHIFLANFPLLLHYRHVRVDLGKISFQNMVRRLFIFLARRSADLPYSASISTGIQTAWHHSSLCCCRMGHFAPIFRSLSEYLLDLSTSSLLSLLKYQKAVGMAKVCESLFARCFRFDRSSPAGFFAFCWVKSPGTASLDVFDILAHS